MEELNWPAGPSCSTFCQLDDLAKCPICHEFYRVPLSLSCGHAYCSACIRSNLEFQERQGRAKCPQCRHPCDTRDLRPCHPLKDLVEGYGTARLLLIEAAQQTVSSGLSEQLPDRRTSGRLQKRQRSSQEVAEHAPLKAAKADRAARPAAAPRHTEDAGHASTRSATTVIDMTKEDSARRLRSKSALRKSRSAGVSDARPNASGSDIALSLSSDSSWGSEPPSQKPKRKGGSTAAKSIGTASKAALAASALPQGYVECPSCTMQLRATLLNEHLDKCLEKDSCDFQVQPRKPQPVSTAGKLEVPPKLVFSMLNNKDLQAKLRACRLSTDGRRQDWEQRYNRFRVEVQIAQDAAESVTLDELARRLTKKERQTAAVAFTGGARSKQATPALAGAASFEELIAKTRERAAQRAATAQPQAPPGSEQQQKPSQAAPPTAQPEQAAQPSGAPQSLPLPSARDALPVPNGGSSRDRLADSSGSGQQEPEDASGEDTRKFSGRPVDSNVQQEPGTGNGAQSKGAVQARLACAGQRSIPAPGASRGGDDAGAAPPGDGALEKARTAMPLHAADVLPKIDLRGDELADEVPDSDPER